MDKVEILPGVTVESLRCFRAMLIARLKDCQSATVDTKALEPREYCLEYVMPLSANAREFGSG